MTSTGFVGRVVRWDTGEAIGGAELRFSGADGAPLLASSDDAGSFAIATPAPGRFALENATAAGFLPYATEWAARPISVDVRAGARTPDVTIALRPDVEYLGVVEDARGERVAGATVQLVDVRSGDGAGVPEAHRSDDRGEFRFHAPDDAVLDAVHPTRGRGRARLDRLAIAKQRVVIRLRPAGELADAGTGRIGGRVVDSDGEPVAAARVRAAHVDAGGAHPRAEVRAGRDGAFQIEGLDPGTHVVWVVCEGCASTRTRADTGTEVVLTIGLGGTLAGRVVEAADGRPVPAFGVRVARKAGVREIVLDEVAVLDDGGYFEVHGLPDGEYQVRVAAPGHAPSEPITAVVDEASTEEVRIALEGGATIHGTVTDRATGAPLSGTRVVVDGTADLGVAGIPMVAAAATDAAGAFEIRGVAAGVRSVRATRGGYHITVVGGIRIVGDARVGPIAVTLAPAKPGEEPQVETYGIGARLRISSDALIIDDVIAGGGAEAAGLTVGDAILGVDGDAVTDLGVQSAIDRTRGPQGTRVVLAVRRTGEDAVRDVAVERRPFRF